MICSQHGQWPSDFEPEHPSNGGRAELTLTQYKPPKVVTFDMCLRCAGEIFGHGPHAWHRPDERFRWIDEPEPVPT